MIRYTVVNQIIHFVMVWMEIANDLCRQPFRGYSSCKSIVYDVGIDGIKKYESAIPYWPCGIQTGQTQDLILGLAGIGYFYLRQYDPINIPSILIITSS